jgi:hypothetical protein
MFKRIVTLVRGLMGCQSTAHSLSAETQPLANAKPLRAKSTQTSKVVRKPRQSAPQPSLKKPKAVSQISAEQKVQSKKRKPVQTVKQPSTLGKCSRTPARQTPQAVLTQPNQKQKPAESTKVAKKATQGKTSVQTPTGRK